MLSKRGISSNYSNTTTILNQSVVESSLNNSSATNLFTIRMFPFNNRQTTINFVVLFIFTFTILLYYFYAPNTSNYTRSGTSMCPYKMHGGPIDPITSPPGSCWCSSVDSYCLCTPSLAIDAIIEHTAPDTKEIQIILVYRGAPPRGLFAIPGGFVNVGESAETATQREVKEETNLTLSSLQQFKLYSEPNRDKRRHTASIVFRCTVADWTNVHRGDDAKEVKIVSLKEALSLPLAFDHKKILTEYTQQFHPGLLPQ